MSHPQGDTTWSYSNTDYVLAGMLIKAVTGRSWAREVDARITGPLGLRHTRTGFVRDLPAEPSFTDDGRQLTVSLFANTGDPDLATTRQNLLADLTEHAFC